MANLVKFNNSLTQAAYNALATKDANTLYFTKDSKRVYKGNDLYSNNVVVLPTLPGTGESDKLYVINNGTNVVLYMWDVTAFKSVSATPLEQVVTEVDFNTANQAFTITYGDASTKTIDLVLESVIQDVSYNNTTKVLSFSLVGGTSTTISLLDLVDAYSGDQTNSTTVSIAADGKITANVRISATAGNTITVNADGLFVPATNISTKMDKVPTAVENNLATFNYEGSVYDSGKAIVATISTLAATDTKVPTEKAVMDKLNELLSWTE